MPRYREQVGEETNLQCDSVDVGRISQIQPAKEKPTRSCRWLYCLFSLLKDLANEAIVIDPLGIFHGVITRGWIDSLGMSPGYYSTYNSGTQLRLCYLPGELYLLALNLLGYIITNTKQIWVHPHELQSKPVGCSVDILLELKPYSGRAFWG